MLKACHIVRSARGLNCLAVSLDLDSGHVLSDNCAVFYAAL